MAPSQCSRLLLFGDLNDHQCSALALTLVLDICAWALYFTKCTDPPAVFLACSMFLGFKALLKDIEYGATALVNRTCNALLRNTFVAHSKAASDMVLCCLIFPLALTVWSACYSMTLMLASLYFGIAVWIPCLLVPVLTSHWRLSQLSRLSQAELYRRAPLSARCGVAMESVSDVNDQVDNLSSELDRSKFDSSESDNSEHNKSQCDSLNDNDSADVETEIEDTIRLEEHLHENYRTRVKNTMAESNCPLNDCFARATKLKNDLDVAKQTIKEQEKEIEESDEHSGDLTQKLHEAQDTLCRREQAIQVNSAKPQEMCGTTGFRELKSELEASNETIRCLKNNNRDLDELVNSLVRDLNKAYPRVDCRRDSVPCACNTELERLNGVKFRTCCIAELKHLLSDKDEGICLQQLPNEKCIKCQTATNLQHQLDDLLLKLVAKDGEIDDIKAHNKHILAKWKGVQTHERRLTAQVRCVAKLAGFPRAIDEAIKLNDGDVFKFLDEAVRGCVQDREHVKKERDELELALAEIMHQRLFDDEQKRDLTDKIQRYKSDLHKAVFQRNWYMRVFDTRDDEWKRRYQELERDLTAERQEKQEIKKAHSQASAAWDVRLRESLGQVYVKSGKELERAWRCADREHQLRMKETKALKERLERKEAEVEGWEHVNDDEKDEKVEEPTLRGQEVVLETEAAEYVLCYGGECKEKSCFCRNVVVESLDSEERHWQTAEPFIPPLWLEVGTDSTVCYGLRCQREDCFCYRISVDPDAPALVEKWGLTKAAKRKTQHDCVDSDSSGSDDEDWDHAGFEREAQGQYEDEHIARMPLAKSLPTEYDEDECLYCVPELRCSEHTSTNTEKDIADSENWEIVLDF